MQKFVPGKFCCLSYTTLGKSHIKYYICYTTPTSCCIHSSVLIGGDAWSENVVTLKVQSTQATLQMKIVTIQQNKQSMYLYGFTAHFRIGIHVCPT